MRTRKQCENRYKKSGNDKAFLEQDADVRPDSKAADLANRVGEKGSRRLRHHLDGLSMLVL